jgi:hypothetical protein
MEVPPTDYSETSGILKLNLRVFSPPMFHKLYDIYVWNQTVDWSYAVQLLVI